MVKRAAFPTRTPYLVAAIDANHDGRLAQARRLVTLAADHGASAVKFAMGASAAPRETLASQAWRALRRDTRGRLDLILAPHDLASFDVARRAAPDAYQVDPPALGDTALLAAIAREKRPVLVVAGACTSRTVAGAVRALGRTPAVVLHAVVADALPPARARLRYIPWLAARFKKPAGYLGMETGIGWGLVAAALGAVVIEKPFTIDRTLAGANHAGSIEPAELTRLAESLRDLDAALGPVGDRRLFKEELASLERSSRSLVAKKAYARGHVLRAGDVVSGPFSGGLGPRLAAWLTGRRLKYDVEAGEPITFGMVNGE